MCQGDISGYLPSPQIFLYSSSPLLAKGLREVVTDRWGWARGGLQVMIGDEGGRGSKGLVGVKDSEDQPCVGRGLAWLLFHTVPGNFQKQFYF